MVRNGLLPWLSHFRVPSVYLLQHFPLSKTLSGFIILWGIVLCLHAAPNYPGFIALRTILGMLESAVTPAFVVLTAQWYKREEQFLRTAIWLGSNGLGLLVGSFMAYGLAVNHHVPIAGWRLIFIITGVITIVVGIVFSVHVPDDPSKAWFLTEEERKLVLIRIRDNQQGFENKKFKKTSSSKPSEITEPGSTSSSVSARTFQTEESRTSTPSCSPRLWDSDRSEGLLLQTPREPPSLWAVFCLESLPNTLNNDSLSAW